MSMKPTAEQELAEARRTIKALGESYRDAIGVPPSEHQARRLEDMAQRLERADAAIAAAIAVCDYADRYEPGVGHWVSTNQIRAALGRLP